jgi:hypothetical protein
MSTSTAYGVKGVIQPQSKQNESAQLSSIADESTHHGEQHNISQLLQQDENESGREVLDSIDRKYDGSEAGVNKTNVEEDLLEAIKEAEHNLAANNPDNQKCDDYLTWDLNKCEQKLQKDSDHIEANFRHGMIMIEVIKYNKISQISLEKPKKALSI